MAEALGSNKRAPAKGKTNDETFEKAFKPNKSDVNFGVTTNERAKKKKKSPVKGIVIVAILVVLLGGAGTAAYFFGYLDPMLMKFGIIKSEAELSLEQRETALNKRLKELDEREKSLNLAEEVLSKERKTLENEKAAAAAVKTFEEIKSELSEQKLEEIKKVALIYSTMDTAAAATVITKVYNTEDIAAIIYYMKPDAAALLLAKLDTALAANVTKMLLS